MWGRLAYWQRALSLLVAYRAQNANHTGFRIKCGMTSVGGDEQITREIATARFTGLAMTGTIGMTVSIGVNPCRLTLTIPSTLIRAWLEVSV
jgi:hypothetical protein